MLGTHNPHNPENHVKNDQHTTKKVLAQMTAKEVLDRDMEVALYGGAKMRKPRVNLKHSEWAKHNPEHLERLAMNRVRTQIGGPGMKVCNATCRKSGLPCRNPALKDDTKCRMHVRGKALAALRERRRAAGKPVDKASTLARRNLRALLKQNKVPLELMREPVFQAVFRFVLPTAFGLPRDWLRGRFDRKTIGDAALLSREMVLAWMAGVDQGDWAPWHAAVAKVFAGGYEIPERPRW